MEYKSMGNNLECTNAWKQFFSTSIYRRDREYASPIQCSQKSIGLTIQMYNILFLHKVQCRMTPIHKSNLIQLSLNSSAATPQAQYFKIKKHIHMMTSRKQEINDHHNLSRSWLLEDMSHRHSESFHIKNKNMNQMKELMLSFQQYNEVIFLLDCFQQEHFNCRESIEKQCYFKDRTT